MVGLALALVDYAILAVPFVVLALVVVLVVRSVVMLDEGKYHVVTEDGEVTEVLDEGFYVRSPLRTGWTIDTSPVNFTLEGRAVETANGERVAGRLTGRFQVTDPETLVATTREYPGDVRRRIDEAYVTQAQRLAWNDEADPQATLEENCHSEVERALERWGVELAALEVVRLEQVE
jgi:regulator of protease activity HflC (stomatin/prohibitin superfamily)